MLKNILKPGLILLTITVIVAGLLGIVNSVTKDAITAQDIKTKSEAQKAVLPSAESFEEAIKVTDKNSIIKEYSKGIKADKSEAGYTFSVVTKGFGSGLSLMVGIANDGTISGLKVVDSSNETPGLGANAEAVLSPQFAGKSGELFVKKDAASSCPDEQIIDAITGATITSRAVTNAVNEVQSFYTELNKGGAN